MNGNHYLDKIKLNRWLNVRKTSLEHLNKLLKNKINFKITLDNCDSLDKFSVNIIAETLDVPVSKLLKKNNLPSFIFKSKNEIEKTRRPIYKDGIHFYNYYTLPTPKGYISPVILDILCPKERKPKLNNGHLEPAITISLGPNDIYARFAEKLNKTTWVKFKVNNDKKTNWVVGSSYFEPSFCRHTYSRATDGPGRILSYTTRSNLENLADGKLNDNSYKNLLNASKNLKINRYLLKQEINDKGYSLEEISKKSKVSVKKINNYINKKNSTIKRKDLNKICETINSDPNLFLDKTYKEDSVGKLYFDYKESLKTIRKFKSYTVSSLVSSKRFPDLSGYFLKIDNLNRKKIIDVFDSKCSHYLVTGGKMKFYIKLGDLIRDITIQEGDSIWTSAFVYHGYTGSGSLIKISDGQNINYLEKIDLVNTYNSHKVLNRAKSDLLNWGYDS